ncbi:oxidoreductase [Actinoplanes ianthinogenes]|uniref:Oxidoreductase n=1 Tax=Actinoplanes ianthinogenes TaxID=122358 RepID=A0ABM7M9V3_9ACTN|nr:aldo/keto reductase [Actinoplanes ianthinogenes]BCJ48383.1 oxidoreductase [Actinoplanes ianthinogenes]GGR46757.1 oxidoreductase [Actinoplanes ianthinogenes]
MEYRDFGRLGRISALTLGGGGIGGVWGSTDRAEATATVYAAIDDGITMLDLAPSYGAGAEAEQLVGAALRKRPAPDVAITSKVQLADDEQGDVAGRIRRSLHDSLTRLGRDHLDLLLLHTHLRPDAVPPTPWTTTWSAYRDEIVPEFERLRAEGLVRGWGITAVVHPDVLFAAFRETHRPDAAQVIVNAMDLDGGNSAFHGTPPAGDAIVRAANAHDVAVIGIRAVAAGALTSTLDRVLPADDPVAGDFVRAEPFRKLAADLGQTPAALAHRYALSVPGVATVVLGVKNRTELAECVTAEALGPLTAEELAAISAIR